MSEKNNDYELISTLFLRLLAILFLCAFASLSIQIIGLSGSDGILPLTNALEIRQDYWGHNAWWRFPTLFWLNASDTALISVTYAGCFASLLLFFNYFPRLSLGIILILYLSLYHAGQIFMNFQWDILLLECGFLALFLSRHSRYVIWLFRWLLFRLRFLSGISKLVSQDPSWLGLTAVTVYFEVQPLPNPLSWYAHQLPPWLLIGATALTLFIEIIVPFMMFLTRRYRFIAAWLTIVMQILIMLTSNHNWFNLLTLALCLFLFDDRAIKSVLPDSLISWLLKKPLPIIRPGAVYRTGMPMLAGFIVFVSGVQMFEMFTSTRVEGRIGQLMTTIKPFAVVNKYHVFPTMRTQRYELVIYGSMDGRQWHEYQFKYKPGQLTEPPDIVMPHHPRLDWMMWFVTLHPHFNTFFESFLDALLDGSTQVSKLLREDPFHGKGPNMIKVELYHYQFSDYETRLKTGQWWQRKYLGPFPPLPFMQKENFSVQESFR